MQFRAEFFNILNHANFFVPVTPDNVTIFDSTEALLQGIAGKTRAREIRFAIKLLGSVLRESSSRPLYGLRKSRYKIRMGWRQA
jgi:hypothetical protein